MIVNMQLKKLLHILILSVLILLTTFIVISFAKYTNKVEVAVLELNITAPEYWEGMTGSGFSNGTFAVKTNTESTLVFEAMGTSRSKRKNKNTN